MLTRRCLLCPPQLGPESLPMLELGTASSSEWAHRVAGLPPRASRRLASCTTSKLSLSCATVSVPRSVSAASMRAATNGDHRAASEGAISDCELRNDDVVPGEEHQPYADQELRTNRFNQDLEDWARRLDTTRCGARHRGVGVRDGGAPGA